MGLANKFFFRSTEEYYNYGEVLEELPEGFYLVRMMGCTKPHTSIFHIAQMSTMDDMNSFSFFDTKEELDEYVAWVEEPIEKKPNIVSLVAKE